MSVTAVHQLYAVNVDVGGTPVLFDQVQDQNTDHGIVNAVLAGDGAVYPTYAYAQRIAPTIGFTTTDLPAALAKAGLTGFAIASGGTLDTYWQAATEGGTRAGASSHFKLSVNQGILVPTTLNADQDAASLGYMVHATYDGSNEPLVYLASQSLAGTASTSVHFVAGPASVNGTTINGVQSITVDFGIQVQTLWADGSHRPTYCYIARIAPTIRIATLDVGIANTLGIAGTAQSATDSVFYMVKCDEGGTRVANATAEHIKFTVDEGRVSTEATGGTDGGELGTTVVITPTYDGTNAILVISTASAIT